MKNLRITVAVSLFFYCVLFLQPLSGAAAQSDTSGLLIRLQLTPENDDLKYFETLIYRDGQVMERLLAGEQMIYRRGSLSATELSRLKTLLNESRVGQIVAQHCETISPFPPEVSFSGALTWFGKNARQNYMSFGSDGGSPCPASLGLLYIEIVQLKVTLVDEVVTQP